MLSRRVFSAALVAALAAAAPAHAAPTDPQGKCTYAGVLVNTTIDYVIGGAVAAPTAIETTATCELTNSSGTVVHSATSTCAGSACVTSGVIRGLPVAPVGICTSGSATYADGSVVTLARTCGSI